MTYLKEVVSLALETEKCTGCRLCVQVCPQDVLEMQGPVVVIRSRDNCIECGACQSNCAFDAIHVNAGVGCAVALIKTVFNPDAEPVCGCSTESAADGCCEGPCCG